MATAKPAGGNKPSSSKDKKGGEKEASTNGRWEKEVDRITAKWYPPTKIQGKPSDLPLSEQSFFDIFELDLNRDNKENSLLISGNDAQVALQASLVRALDQLYDYRGLGYFDFDKWATDFELGYNRFTTGAPAPLKKEWEKEVWPGVERDNRPRIIEIKPDARKKEREPDFHVVLVQRDRDDPDSEIVRFTGSYRQIVDKIELWWQIKAGEGGVSDEKIPGKNSQVSLEGQPVIKLNFVQDAKTLQSTDNNWLRQPATGAKFIRLMKITDDPKIAQQFGLSLISKNDCTTIAQKILQEFASGGGFIWQKGKSCLNYRGKIARRQGFEGYAFVKNKQNGIDLFTKILKCVDLTPDPAGFSYSENTKPSEAFPDNPQKVSLFGKQITPKRRRPIVDVRFASATLYLPSIPHPIGLVHRGKVSFNPDNLKL